MNPIFMFFLITVGTVSLGEFSAKIIGGEEAPVGAWPFMAAIELAGFGHMCGASLVSDEWLLTAAHCTDGFNKSDLTIMLGQHDRFNQSIGSPQAYQVAEVIQHEDYTIEPSLVYNDIAVIRIAEKADLENPYIGTVQMAELNQDFTGKFGWIMGWGLTNSGEDHPGERSPTLQQAEIGVYTREYCESFYDDGMVHEKQICVGFPGLRGACNTDSGGPLVVDGILAGVLSWGGEKCIPLYPSVYESVALHRQWVFDKIGF